MRKLVYAAVIAAAFLVSVIPAVPSQAAKPAQGQAPKVTVRFAAQARESVVIQGAGTGVVGLRPGSLRLRVTGASVIAGHYCIRDKKRGAYASAGSPFDDRTCAALLRARLLHARAESLGNGRLCVTALPASRDVVRAVPCSGRPVLVLIPAGRGRVLLAAGLQDSFSRPFVLTEHGTGPACLAACGG